MTPNATQIRDPMDAIRIVNRSDLSISILRKMVRCAMPPGLFKRVLDACSVGLPKIDETTWDARPEPKP